MIIGAHESVSGGLFRAIERAQIDGAAALQVLHQEFGDVARAGARRRGGAAFSPGAPGRGGARRCSRTRANLINLATDDPALLERSKTALVAEVERSRRARHLLHACSTPGAHLGKGEDEALDRVAVALDEVHARTPDATARVLLENTAGQGTCVGSRLRTPLARIFERTSRGRPPRASASTRSTPTPPATIWRPKKATRGRCASSMSWSGSTACAPFI